MKPQSQKSARRQRGFTLIEMMVAIAVSMVLALVAFTMMVALEGGRRTLSSTNDIDQSGNYAMSLFDKWLRSAGSGFAQSANYSFGCPINAQNGGTQLLPATAAFPTPFDSVSTTVRLAPVLILPSQNTPAVSGSLSDELIVMSGASGGSEVGVPFGDSSTTSALTVTSIAGFQTSDIVLITDQQPDSSGNIANCLVTQLDSTTAPAGTTLTLGTTGFGLASSANVNGIDASKFTANGVVLRMGTNGGTVNTPSLQMIGVGDNDTLYTYDLLQLSSATPSPKMARADGVFELHALYGVQQTPGSTTLTWTTPTGNYSVANLTAGTPAAALTLKTIKAIRVGLILRTSLPERTAQPVAANPFKPAASQPTNPVITAGPLTLFSDLTCCTFTRTLSATEQGYRYRTIESTIPLRNSLML